MILGIAAIIKIAVFTPLFLIKETSIFGYKISDFFKSKKLELGSPSLPSPNFNDENDGDPSSTTDKKGGSLPFKICKYINKKMDLGFYFALLKSMEIDIFLTSWISLKTLTTPTIWSILSNCVVFFFLTNNIIYTILTLKIFYIHILPKKVNKIWQGKKMVVAKSQKNAIVDKEFEKENRSLILYFKEMMRPDT